MAIYFLRSKHISRGKGSRVTRAAAYRAGERIRDERTSEVYNHSNRDDVVAKDVVLPSHLADREDMRWATDRSTLWNAAEHAGRRRDSRLARELLVFLPPELTRAQRSGLVRTLSQELADKYGGAVDYTIHNPRPSADPRHHHAHLLLTTRQVTPDGLGSRTTLELGGRERYLRGLGASKDEFLLLRERWAELTNDSLREAGSAARIDHRSLKDQGINREPTPMIPQKVFYAERKSQSTRVAGDAIRARYLERVEARTRVGDELARVLQRQKDELRRRAIANLALKDGQPKKIRWGSLTRDERNQIRRERYAASREKLAQYPAYRKANAEELNRKQREYRKVLRAQHTVLDYIRRAPTAEESVRNWLAHRQTQAPPPTAEESARNWLALRESRERSDSARTATQQPAPEPRSAGAGASDDDNDPNRKPPRSRDYDFGL